MIDCRIVARRPDGTTIGLGRAQKLANPQYRRYPPHNALTTEKGLLYDSHRLSHRGQSPPVTRPEDAGRAVCYDCAALGTKQPLLRLNSSYEGLTKAYSWCKSLEGSTAKGTGVYGLIYVFIRQFNKSRPCCNARKAHAFAGLARGQAREI